jgi:hypothetical protein
VIAIIPIMVAMPAMFVLIPPLVALSPAPLAGFVQFVAPVVRLPAVRSMVLDRFMQFVFGMRGTPGAIVLVGGGSRRTREQERDTQRGGRQCFSCDES